MIAAAQDAAVPRIVLAQMASARATAGRDGWHERLPADGQMAAWTPAEVSTLLTGWLTTLPG
jgi:hypothetical protein